ncbi:MAG: TRAP transporter substrate-binding protein [Burkholderiaceae bacterium]
MTVRRPKYRMRIRTAAATIAAAVLSLCAAAAQAETLKLGHALIATSHYGVGTAVFASEVDKRSGGRLKIQEFPASALGGEREMIEAVQLGTLDLVLTSTGPVGNFVPETLITDIPFLFTDYEHARRTLDGPIGQEILAKCESRNLVCLNWWENGFRHITNNKHAVRTPDDLKGLKLRTMENPVHMTAFRAMGALPTPMAFPELYGALQQGTVDGQENPMPVILSSRFAQVQKYLSLTGHVYSPALLIMSRSVYDKLGKDDQAIVREAARLGAAANRQKVQADETRGVEAVRSAGMQVVTDIDRRSFQQILQPAYAEYAKRFGQANIDRLRNAR